MQRLAPYFVVVASVVSGSCFTSTDPLYCDGTHLCLDAERPYCDVMGVEGPSNTCVATPIGDDCSSAACVNPTPICEPTALVCVFCSGDGECEALADPDRAVCVEGACLECAVDMDCPAGEPVCGDAGSCVSCVDGVDGDAACAARGDGRELCVGGLCSECAADTDCAGTTPICNTGAGVCEACVKNSECPSELCDTETGACVEESNVVYAGGDNAVAAGGCGTMAAPCETIAQALVKVDGTRRWVKLADEYFGAVLSLGAVDVTIVGNGDTDGDGDMEANIVPAIDETDTPVVSVVANSNVVFRDVAIANGAGNAFAHGVSCAAAGNSSVTLLRSHLSGSAGIGVSSTGCTLNIEASVIENNAAGGIKLDASSFTLRNNFITTNGVNGVSNNGGVTITAPGEPAIFEFNTVATNGTGTGAAGVDCTSVAPLAFANNIIAKNIGDPGNAINAGNCTHDYSCIDIAATGNNLDVSAVTLFPESDYHLLPDSMCQDAADPAATLATDIDGDARPQGSARDIGADEVTGS